MSETQPVSISGGCRHHVRTDFVSSRRKKVLLAVANLAEGAPAIGSSGLSKAQSSHTMSRSTPSLKRAGEGGAGAA